MIQLSLKRAIFNAALGGVGFTAGVAQAGTVLEEFREPMHINYGKDGNAGRATGAILTDSGALGSGTVINPGDLDGDGDDEREISQWVLTAAHVVIDTDGMFFGTGGDISALNAYRATSWYIPDSYTGNVVDESDLALVRLDRIVDPETPRLDLYDGNQEVGHEFRVYGYGLGGTGSTGQGFFPAGIKRAGDNRFDGASGPNGAILNYDFDVDPDDEEYDPFWEIFYAFDNGTGFDSLDPTDTRPEPQRDYRIPKEYSAAQGDSGGPLVIGEEIVGITSFGNLGSFFTSSAGNVRVSKWDDWIYSVINQVEDRLADGDPDNDDAQPAGFTFDDSRGKVGVRVGREGDGIDIFDLINFPDFPDPVPDPDDDPDNPDDPDDPDNPDDTARSVFRAYADLMRRHYNPNDQLSLGEQLSLLGRRVTDTSNLGYAQALGLTAADLEGLDDDEVASLLVEKADALLAASLDPLFERVALGARTKEGLEGGISDFGYYLGLAELDVLKAYDGAPIEGINLGEYFDFSELEDYLATIPEPTSGVLLLGTLGTLALRRRRA